VSTRSHPIWVLATALAVAPSGCDRRSEDLLVTYTGDCQALVEPCGCTSGRLGGIARRATALLPVVAAHPARLGVDAGNWSAPDEADRRLVRSQLFLAAARDFGLEIANVSMRDLRLGRGGLAQVCDSTGVQFVSANVHVDGAAWLVPYVVLSRRVGGREMRIGVTGVAHPGEPGDDWAGARPRIEDPIAAARRMLAVLETQTDLQVLLAALPLAVLEPDLDILDGYDVVVAGAGDLRQVAVQSRPPFLVSPGTKCKFATWLALDWRADGVAVDRSGTVTLDATVPDAPEWAARAAHIGAQLRPVPPPPPSASPAAGPGSVAPKGAVD